MAGWWFRGSSFAPPTPLLTTPFLPARALLDTRSRLRSLSWKVGACDRSARNKDMNVCKREFALEGAESKRPKRLQEFVVYYIIDPSLEKS